MSRLIYMPGVCRECGCTDDKACVAFDGSPCFWMEDDLCSECAADGDQPFAQDFDDAEDLSP